MKYQISQDGVIYSINDDSSITKYGRITADGMLQPAESHAAQQQSLTVTREPARRERRRPVWGYWLMIILLLMACAVGAFVIWTDTGRIESLRQQVKELSGQNSSTAGTLRQKDELIENLQNQLSGSGRLRVEAENALKELTEAASATAPLIVSSVDFANYAGVRKPLGRFGEPLKQSTLCYLKIRVNYYGLRQGLRRLDVRIYTPAGTLMGTGHYSFGSECPVETGANHSLELPSYGYLNAGRWATGRYLVEIYSGGVCIFRHNFTVT